MNLFPTDQWPALVTFLMAAGVCAVFLRITRVMGKQFGLVDKPTARKQHRGHIPLVGGASIFLTYVVMNLGFGFSFSVIAASGLLLMVGMTDDYVDLSPVSRLFFQASAAAILVIGGGYQIVSVGNLFGAEAIIFGGVFAVLFTIVCVIGVVNAINMIDGADGLAGGIVSISLVGLLISASSFGNNAHLNTGIVTVLGATAAFLLFNTGLMGTRKKIFLGDSGSMFLGIVMASYYINMSQGQSPYITPVVAGWIFGLPLMDSISVMVGRVLRGSSPLKAGRDHLHHRLMDNGMTSGHCVITMLIFHSTLVAIGLVGNHFDFPMPIMFWGFVALTVAHHFVTPRLIAQFSENGSRRRRFN